MLNKRAGKAPLLWIAGHYGIAGNEEADACVKQAAAITKGIHPTSLLRPSRTKDVYTKTCLWPADYRAASTRRVGILLARLRAGPQGLRQSG